MKSSRFLDRRVGFSLGALTILFGTLAPAIVPVFASADSQITSRSVQLSSATTSATNVQYKVSFTPNETGTQYMAIEFCNNSPLIGAPCLAPHGMVVNTASLAVSGDSAAIDGSGADVGANYVDMTATLTSGSNVITIGSSSNGVTNPDGTDLTNGTFYARIMVFDTQAHADAVNGSGSESTANMKDDGSVALAVNNAIGVQASVLESLTFCVFGDPGNSSGAGTANNASDDSAYLSGNSATGITDGSHTLYQIGGLATNGTVTNQAPGSDCTDTGAGTTAGTGSSVPASVKLGENVASNIYALSSSAVSHAVDWAQLSTNAAHGAVVYLQSGNTCSGGGLSRGDGTSCDIPGASSGLSSGTAGFGVALGSAINLDGQTGTGTDGKIVPSSTYNNGSPVYALGASTNAAYGDAFFNTNSAVATNWDVPFGIGAAISNNTPAGNYSDSLNLVAVGTF